MTLPFRFAICNELFEHIPLSDAAQQIRRLGYEGVEIAPFTLAENPAELTPTDRQDIRRILKRSGLHFVGLHWLLVGPPGLHATTRDEPVRVRTWNYVHSLIDLCADLARGSNQNSPLLVFGSPEQRSTADDMAPREAVDMFTQELVRIAPHAESRGVTILVEALSPSQCDVVNSLAEAASIVQQIGSPAIQTMFDAHNAIDEKKPHADLLRRYFSMIRHVHVNEMDGREPGAGDYDFAPLLLALQDLNYSGWISLEVFDFTRDPVEIARNSIEYLKAQLAPSVTSQIV